jgi:hypothetical protein
MQKRLSPCRGARGAAFSIQHPEFRNSVRSSVVSCEFSRVAFSFTTLYWMLNAE